MTQPEMTQNILESNRLVAVSEQWFTDLAFLLGLKRPIGRPGPGLWKGTYSMAMCRGSKKLLMIRWTETEATASITNEGGSRVYASESRPTIKAALRALVDSGKVPRTMFYSHKTDPTYHG